MMANAIPAAIRQARVSLNVRWAGDGNILGTPHGKIMHRRTQNAVLVKGFIEKEMAQPGPAQPSAPDYAGVRKDQGRNRVESWLLNNPNPVDWRRMSALVAPSLSNR